jgi:hypothetical protein
MALTSTIAIPITASSTPTITYYSNEPYTPLAIFIIIPICVTIIYIIVTLVVYNILKIRLFTRLRAELFKYRDKFIY